MSSLLTICKLARECTTNSLSSGFLEDAAGKLHSSVSEKKVDLSFFFELQDVLGQSPRVSAGTSLLSFISSSVRTALMKNFDLNFSERRTFAFSDVCMTLRSCWELHSSSSFQDFCALPQNRSPLLLHFCHHPFSFCWVDLKPACVQTITYRRIYNRIRLKGSTFGRMPIVTKWFGANTFQVIFARLSSELPRWTPASEVLFPSMHFYLVVLVVQRVVRFWVSVLHAYLHRARNCIGLLLNTAPFAFHW